jgi:hypothetical protein
MFERLLLAIFVIVLSCLPLLSFGCGGHYEPIRCAPPPRIDETNPYEDYIDAGEDDIDAGEGGVDTNYQPSRRLGLMR